VEAPRSVVRMDLTDARVLVAGASGALGGSLARRLVAEGARVVAAGRDAERLQAVAQECGTEPVTFDVVDAESCEQAVARAHELLGGLDGLVVTVGAPAFGRALDTEAAVSEELFAVNTLGPMALVRAAAARMDDGGFVAVFSAILADQPAAQMADYSAAKSALSAWMQVLRREERRRLTVLDVRPPHLDTGLETRPLAGEAPRLPEPLPAEQVVDAVVEAIRAGKQEVLWDPREKRLTIR
jgi:NAD(P)-dependent dehydrogenase (short-subunit alcohol dehydrogenase family)